MWGVVGNGRLGNGMNPLDWEKMINFWLASCKDGCNSERFCREQPGPGCLRAGGLGGAGGGGCGMRSAIGHRVRGDPRFGAFLTLFRLKFLYQEYFEYVFLLSVYRNAKDAEMETLKLDGSCEVRNCNLFVVLKLPPGKSDYVYVSFFNVAIP